MKNKSLLREDIKKIFSKSFKRIIAVSIFMSFLFYLFNIFSWLSIKSNDINEVITNKVGIYFYIKDDIKTPDEIFKRVLNIKDELNKHWIISEFSSKDDAFNYLENKVPDITKNFDKFGIENPLPSTLYVMFKNQKEYNKMKDIIVNNKDIILNIKDIDVWASLVQQENRSLRILKITDTIKTSFYLIVIMLWVIIIFFTQHLLRHFFNNFYEEIEIKKLLWGNYLDVNWWFLATLGIIITIWFIIWFWLTCLTFNILHQNLLAINIDLWFCNAVLKLLPSYIWFLWIWILLGYLMLKKMEKKF